MIHRLFLVLLLCAAFLGGVAPAWALAHGGEAASGAQGAAHDHHHAMADDPGACKTAEGGPASHDGADAAGCPGAASACGGAFAGWPVGFGELTGRLPRLLPEPGPGRHLTALVLSPDLRPPRSSS